MLIKLWERKFDLEVRGIDVCDINFDGIDEVILASWDARIYAVAHNKILWTTKEQEFSGENVIVVKDSLGRPTCIVGSFHKDLVCFNLNGKELWKLPFSSWIVRLLDVGPHRHGVDDLLILDLRGTIHYLDAEGNILWSIKNAFGEGDLEHILYGVAIDPHNHKIFLADRRQIKIMDFLTGTLQKKKGISRKIFGISLASILRQKPVRMLVVGAKDEVIFFDPDTLEEKTRFSLPFRGEAQIVYSSDLDGDLNDEIIVGSWSKNALAVLKYDEKKGNFYVVKTFKVEGNPLYISAHDLLGDYRKEIVVGTDKNKIYIIVGLKEINEIESYCSFHSISYGNTIGFGPRDILLRPTKETLACYSLIPRIWFLMERLDKPRGKLYVITPSATRISADKTLLLDSKNRKLIRKSFNKKTVMFYEIPFKAKYKGQLSEVSIRKNKVILLKSYIPIPDREKLTSLTKSLALAEEDKISIEDLKIEKEKIYVEAEGIKIVDLSIKNGRPKLAVIRNANSIFTAKITLLLRKGSSKQKRILQTYDFVVIPMETLQIRMQLDKILSTKDMITLFLRNNSGRNIPYSISSEGTLRLSASGKLLPHSEKPLKLSIAVKSDSPKIEINEILNVTYGNAIRRTIKLPIKAIILNVGVINERARKIYNATKDRRIVIETLSRELQVPKNLIEKLIEL